MYSIVLTQNFLSIVSREYENSACWTLIVQGNEYEGRRIRVYAWKG